MEDYSYLDYPDVGLSMESIDSDTQGLMKNIATEDPIFPGKS